MQPPQLLLSIAVALLAQSPGVGFFSATEPGPNGAPAGVLAVGAGSAGSTTPHPRVPVYESLDELLGRDARRARMWTVRGNLEAAFDYICGDTFCEGDYSNLRPLALDCSVERGSEVLQSCLWTFAGSYAFVDAQSGAFIERSSRTFECAVPMNGLTVDGFLSTLEPEGPGVSVLERPLGVVEGRAGPSFYDALLSCL